MKKKWIKLLLGLTLFLSGCGSQPAPNPPAGGEQEAQNPSEQPSENPSEQPSEQPGEGGEQEETMYNYYPKFGLGEELYYIKGSDLNVDEALLIRSLQGILAQKGKASVYIDASDNNPQTSYVTWREDLEEKYGLKFTYESSPYELLKRFRRDVDDMGYVLYDRDSVNGATTAAGVHRYLLVSAKVEARVQELGFCKKLDYVAERKEAKGSFDKVIFERYKEELNKSVVIHQSPDKWQLRDYAIATRAACFYVYSPRENPAENAFAREVYDWSEKDIPVLGWAEDELSFVDLNGEYGKITIAADWSENLSFLGAVPDVEIKQTNFKPKTIVPEKGKHYVAIVMSDGDNVQWYEGNFLNHPKYYANEYKGSFPITYGISPSLADLAPSAMQKIYSSAAPNEYFIAAASGQGYINATEYSHLSDFAARTDDYLKKSDLKYSVFLDEGRIDKMDASFWQEFAKYDTIRGGLWMFGDKYMGGLGAVHWSNGKPLIAFRDAIWEEDPRRAALRVGSYKKDYRSIEGYTLLCIHCWSTPYDLIKRFVDSLPSHVELVTVDTLFDMVTEYVPHEDKVYLDDLNPLSASDFRYDTTNAVAYNNQLRRLETGEPVHDFNRKGKEGYGINLADGMSVSLEDGWGLNGSKALVFYCARDTFSGENAYVMFKDSAPEGGAKYLEFYVKGTGKYIVKQVSIVGSIEVLQGETSAPEEYVKVRIPLKSAGKTVSYIIEQNGAGFLAIDDVRLVSE